LSRASQATHSTPINIYKRRAAANPSPAPTRPAWLMEPALPAVAVEGLVDDVLVALDLELDPVDDATAPVPLARAWLQMSTATVATVA